MANSSAAGASGKGAHMLGGNGSSVPGNTNKPLGLDKNKARAALFRISNNNDNGGASVAKVDVVGPPAIASSAAAPDNSLNNTPLLA